MNQRLAFIGSEDVTINEMLEIKAFANNDWQVLSKIFGREVEVPYFMEEDNFEAQNDQGKFDYTKRLQPKGHKKYMRCMNEDMDEQASEHEPKPLTDEQKEYLQSIKEDVKDYNITPFIEFVLEVINSFDMVLDVAIIHHFFRSGHVLSFAALIFGIVQPYLVNYTPFLSFIKSHFANAMFDDNIDLTCTVKFIAFLSVTPTIVPYLFIMDILFMTSSSVLELIAFLLKLLTCGCLNVDFMSHFIENNYRMLFHMTKLDVEGFNRQRNITQLMFQTTVQLIFVVKMIIYYTKHP